MPLFRLLSEFRLFEQILKISDFSDFSSRRENWKSENTSREFRDIYLANHSKQTGNTISISDVNVRNVNGVFFTVVDSVHVLRL